MGMKPDEDTEDRVQAKAEEKTITPPEATTPTTNEGEGSEVKAPT